MEVCRRSSWLLLLLGVSLLATTLQGVQGEAESEGPSESECRPYIEKALKELETGESGTTAPPETGDSKEDIPTVEVTNDDSDHQEGEGDDDTHEEGTESIESAEADQKIPDEQQDQEETQDEASAEGTEPGDVEDTDTQEEHEGSQETEAGTSGENDDQKTEEDTGDDTATEGESQEGGDTVETAEGEDTQETVEENEAAEDDQTEDEQAEDIGETQEETDDTKEEVDDTREEADDTKEETDDTKEVTDDTKEETDDTKEETDDTKEETDDTKEDTDDTKEEADDTKEDADDTKEEIDDTKEDADDTKEEIDDTKEEADDTKEEAESVETEAQAAEQASEEGDTKEESTEGEQAENAVSDQEGDKENAEEQPAESVETQGSQEEGTEDDTKEDEQEGTEDDTKEDEQEGSREKRDTKSEDTEDDKSDTKEEETAEEAGSPEVEAVGDADERSAEKDDSTPDEVAPEESKEGEAAEEGEGESAETVEKKDQESEDAGAESEDEEQTTETEEGSEEEESAPEEELSLDIDIPSELRDRGHVEHLLKLDEEASETENIINRVAEITLRELKKLYENAIKPLEVLYKYRDLSNRHFGDAEIFSKPLILFMGPWSGGKSSIINYLLDNEYNETSLRTGAEPSPAYFNILMYGEEPEIWDGTQLAADFTFSGLQKFGQGLEERLRGVKLPNKLLEKVNIVEIPGILEVRKQVSRVFPFNDACQWFIDRADIIFLVYDPSKLDVGPETEAILDQLKGREHQTRIILNKADQVKPEELMRVQGALIWNISPLMSSPQPPVMYTTSLWSRPYESWAPTRLLQAQERAFLRDLRSAVDKRIENKIASARRFAVRVRNHAKMVDCYLTTYYNHKSVFGNRKQVADEIIEHPQDYHIYEGLSTLTNISRYDLPDPDVYRDFFKLNPLYDFQQLSATCTYFRGCPINRLDVAIAYDLPELIGKHKRLVESALAEANQTPVPSS